MRRLLLTAMTAVMASSLALTATPVQAKPDPAPAGTPQPAKDAPPRRDRVADPDRVLGKTWRTSTDRAVTGAGDETGYHLMVADEKEAYRWHSVATLAEPGWLTDEWIGQFCVTASGRRAVVVYGPRQFTNDERLMDAGGFAAVVDLTSGAVTKLGAGATLAYYNPGCGAGEQAAVSRLEHSGDATRTWVGLVDTAKGRVTRQVRADGQLTSPVPVKGDIVAARGASLVALDASGGERRLAQTTATPFRVHADATAGVVFQTAEQGTARFHRYAGGAVTEFASAPAGTVKLRPGAGGRVYLAGRDATRRMPRTLPGGLKAVDAAPDSDISTTGALVVSRVSRHGKAGDAAPTADDTPDELAITAATAAGAAVEFTARPQPDPQQRSAPLPGAGTMSLPTGDYSNVSYEPDRTCAISRNDPQVQVYQPSFQQVEWAADLAVQNKLTFSRPANWSNNGMAAYAPQGLFPSVPLVGGGAVPAQVMLGILAQESNLWQASWHVVDGAAGNALNSLGYYGLDLNNPNYLNIDWAKVDCGYGVAQVTTGMRLDDRGKVVDGLSITDVHQKAVALDYATNIAAGLRILQNKWNQTRSAGLIANNGDPRYIENWWFAIWAYNTGFYPNAGDGSPWGVGWSNNPANPKYPADRAMFLTKPLDVGNYDDNEGYDNARHPNHWSYPERVMGWAYRSLIKYNYQVKDYGPTYRTASLGANMFAAQPALTTFCAPGSIAAGGNECAPGTQNPNDLGDPAGPCTRRDLKCWWHAPVTWTDCAINCGQSALTYGNVDPRPFYNTIYPSKCTIDPLSAGGLPSGVKIIDDIDVSAATGPAGCAPNWTKGGRFSLKFGEQVRNGTPYYPSKIDFHQIGAGFGGHFWFTHTLPDNAANQVYKITGTWNIDPTNAWTRVFVHLPDNGAHTTQARYVITLPNGQTRYRVIPTRWEKNTWVDLGVFDFTGGGQPKVELSNFTKTDGGNNFDVAWDALAVQPLAAKPKHMIVTMGDSYSSGEGTADYEFVSNQYGAEEDDKYSGRKNSCRRSPHAWSRKLVLPGAPASIGQLEKDKNANLDYHMIACSGAKSHNLLPMGITNAFGISGQPKVDELELPQLDQGFVNPDTTLVMLTIGGNDARFVPVITGCIEQNPYSLDGCADEDFVLQYKDDWDVPRTDPEPLRDYQLKIIKEKVNPSVRLVLDQIKAAAPNAKILLLGYPRIFDGYDPAAGCPPDGLNHTEADYLNLVGDQLFNEATAPNVGGQVIVADARTPFIQHGVCSADPYINSLDLTPSGGGDTSIPGMDSFHPNDDGYQTGATIVRDALDQNNIRW